MTLSDSPLRLPADFVWGAATAAYQIEGAVDADGRSPSIWDTFCHPPGRTHHGDTGDIACDHYHRVESDLDLIASLGLHAYRFSVSWSRIKSADDGATNSAGLDFYSRMVDGLLQRGIEPIVTLYHWDLPQWVQDKGGWASRHTAEHFADLTDALVGQLGDRVHRWITLNEPYCAAYIGHLEGRHAPGIRDEATAVAAVHHLLVAHGRAVQQIREGAPDALVGITLNLSDPLPASQHPADLAAASRVDLVENRMFLDPLFRGRYPEDAGTFYRAVTDFGFVRDGDLELISAPLDFFGINYYEQHLIAADPDDAERGVRKLDPEPPITAGGVGVRPDGLRRILNRVHRDWTPLPLWITENGLALHDYVTPDGQCHDPERISYLDAHFRAAAAAIEDGVPLQGYLVWSLMDNFEWALGYSMRFGMIFVDYATQRRTPKDSALWMADMIAGSYRTS
ncbi:MAG: GH1 family beta-glucosidase [Actinomycetota bacterium]